MVLTHVVKNLHRNQQDHSPVKIVSLPRAVSEHCTKPISNLEGVSRVGANFEPLKVLEYFCTGFS